MTGGMHTDSDDIADVILALLRSRAASATACPSEVARAIAPTRWRPLMPVVREVALAMAAAGELEVRQRGRTISPFDEVRGPVRLALPRDERQGTPRRLRS